MEFWSPEEEPNMNERGWKEKEEVSSAVRANNMSYNWEMNCSLNKFLLFLAGRNNLSIWHFGERIKPNSQAHLLVCVIVGWYSGWLWVESGQIFPMRNRGNTVPPLWLPAAAAGQSLLQPLLRAARGKHSQSQWCGPVRGAGLTGCHRGSQSVPVGTVHFLYYLPPLGFLTTATHK